MTDYNVAWSTSTSTDCGHSDVCAPTTFRRNPWRPLVHQPYAPAPFISESYLHIWHGSSLSFSMGVKIGLITFLHAVHLGSRLYLRVIRVPNPNTSTQKNDCSLRFLNLKRLTQDVPLLTDGSQ